MLRFGICTLLFSLTVVACAPITPPPPPLSQEPSLPLGASEEPVGSQTPSARTPITPSGGPAGGTPATPSASGSPVPDSLPPGGTPAPARLVLWENLPPAQSEALAADVAAFEADQAYYTLEIQHYDDTPTLVEAVRGQTVDFHLALGDAALASALQSGGDLAALDDLLPRQLLEGFAGPALTGATRDGHIWALPDTAGLHLLLFYNRDLVAVPPVNIEELQIVAESFTGEGRWGLVMNSYDPLWVAPWLWPFGGWLTDSQGNPTLDSPAMVSALAVYQGWHGEPSGVAPLATYAEARELFLSGEAAMLIDGEWAIGELSQAGRVNWGVAPLPTVGETGQPAAPLVTGRYWLVKSGLPDPEREAAASFLAFISAPPRQLDRTARFGVLPTRLEALKDPVILGDPNLRASAQQMQAGRGLVLNVDANRILDAMRQPLRAVLEGDMAPEEAARAMQAALE